MSRPNSDEPRKPNATPAVYRRRRLFLVCAVVLIVVLVFVVVRSCSGGAQNGGAQSGADASASPSVAGPSLVSASASASPSASASASAVPSLAHCSTDALILTPAVSKATYAASESPVFTLVLKNNGDVPCMVQLAPSDLHFVVSHGDKTIWRLQDCLSGGTKSVVALQVGQSQTATYTWQRIRSADGRCDTSEANRVTEAGNFEMTASIPGFTSEQVAKFTLE